MLLSKAKSKNGPQGRDEDTFITPNRESSISWASCLSIFVNCLIGMGAIRNGRHNNTGILLNLLINVILALVTYYGMWMLLYVINCNKSTSYETCWTSSGFRFPGIISIGIFLPCIGFMSLYFSTIHLMFSTLMEFVWQDCPRLVKDNYVVSFVVVILILPIIFQQDLRYLAVTSHIANAITIVFVGFCVYFCVKRNLYYGFNDKNQISVFDLSKDWMSAFGDYVGTYTAYAFLFLSVRTMYNFTYKRSKKLLLYTLIIFCIFNEIIGLITYFVLYNDGWSDPVFLYSIASGNIAVVLAFAVFMVKIALLIPTLVDPIRISVLHIIKVSDHYPPYIWGGTAFILMLVSLMFSTLTNRYIAAFSQLLNSYVMLMQYAFPAFMLFKKMKTNNLPKIHYAGIVLLSLLGFGFGIYCLIDMVSLF